MCCFRLQNCSMADGCVTLCSLFGSLNKSIKLIYFKIHFTNPRVAKTTRIHQNGLAAIRPFGQWTSGTVLNRLLNGFKPLLTSRFSFASFCPSLLVLGCFCLLNLRRKMPGVTKVAASSAACCAAWTPETSRVGVTWTTLCRLTPVEFLVSPTNWEPCVLKIF